MEVIPLPVWLEYYFSGLISGLGFDSYVIALFPYFGTCMGWAGLILRLGRYLGYNIAVACIRWWWRSYNGEASDSNKHIMNKRRTAWSSVYSHKECDICKE